MLLSFIDVLSVFLVPLCSVEIHIGGAKGPPDRVGSPLALFVTNNLFIPESHAGLF